MGYGLASGTPLLIEGLGVMIGEWLFGPSGPVSFHGLGAWCCGCDDIWGFGGSRARQLRCRSRQDHASPKAHSWPCRYGMRIDRLWEQACGSEDAELSRQPGIAVR